MFILMQVNYISMRFQLYLLLFCLVFIACKNTPENNGIDQNNKLPFTTEKAKEQNSKIKDLTIKENSFMNFKVGDKIVEDDFEVRESVLETGEGVFIIYNLFNKEYGKLGYLMPNDEIEKKVRLITVLNPLVKTTKGIHVGSTFSELLQQFPEIKVNGSEIESRTFASQGNLRYRLSYSSNEYNLDKSVIPLSTAISEIIIYK